MRRLHVMALMHGKKLEQAFPFPRQPCCPNPETDRFRACGGPHAIEHRHADGHFGAMDGQITGQHPVT